jgi:hypothetical protein
LRDTDSSTEKLRRAFADDERGRHESQTCPGAESIWEAVHLRLPAARRRSIVEHIAGCASCAADWRVAMRSEERTAEAAPEVLRFRASTRAAWVRRGAFAAAAAGIAAVGLIAVYRISAPEPVPPVVRAAQEVEIRSLVPEDRALPRDRAVLRWTPLEEGTRYSLELARQDLEPLDSAYGLESGEYRLSPEIVEKLEPGEAFVWRVEARLPDGRSVASPAFLNRLE